MHVVVLGAGLAGVTTAWYLARDGHQVTLVDRQPDAGLETSFANGGQISASHPEPWANPGAPRQILRWLGREDAPLLFRPRADWRQWWWGLKFLLECLPGRTARNTDAIARLAVYSRDELKALRRELALEYDYTPRGILHLFFDAAEAAHLADKVALLARYGMRGEVCDAARCRAIEPALSDTRAAIAGGLYAPDDEAGDAQQFTRALATRCAERGVRLRYGCEARGLRLLDGRIAGARLHEVASGEPVAVQAECYVLAAGSYSPLLTPPGERLPIYPVKGYSLTLALPDDARAPLGSITDEARRVVLSRLGGRLRIAGTAELNGYDRSINHARCDAIHARALELFPDLARAGVPELWAGLRPATPSNVPIIGRSRYPGLWYNTGHGTLGWTLACGSARALADLIAGRRPALEFPFRQA